MAVPCQLIAQSPSCGFTVAVSSTGLATVDLAAAPGSWCKNAIDWGDGCINESTTDPATHQYVHCGNFTIQHTIYDAACNEAGTCSESLTVSVPAVFIALSKTAQSTGCGIRQKLKAVVSVPSGCQPANQPVIVSGTIPSDFLIVGGNFTATGNTVTATVTAAQINDHTAVLEIWLIPRWCSSNDPVQIELTASTTGMALSSSAQPNICEPNPNINSLSVGLQWEFMPFPKCPNISAEVQSCQRAFFKEISPISGSSNTWSFGDGTSLDGNNLTHYYIQPGAYTVTVTTYNYCNGAPQLNEQTRAVTVGACGDGFDCKCTGANSINIDATTGLTVSQIGFPENPVNPNLVVDLAQHGNCIAVKGQIIVDRDLAFTGPSGSTLPEIRMQPCAGFNVPQKRQLSLGFINIHGCQSPLPMWRGIQIEPHGRISALFNRIADAEFAITLVPSGIGGPNLLPTSAVIMGNRFERNHVGVYLPGYNTEHLVSQPWPFVGNSFDGEGRLNSPCDPHLENYDMDFGYFGVAALNTDFNIGTSHDAGYTNHFRNLRNGVIGQDCRINVFHAQFQDIRGEDTDDPLFQFFSQGIAVSALSRLVKPAALASRIQNCSIERSSVGIFSKFHPVEARDNILTSVGDGISIAAPVRLIAQDNQIEFLNNGILLRGLNPLYPSIAQYWIDRNQLNTLFPQDDADGTAIKVELVNNSNLPSSAFHILDNQIHLSTVTNGIYLSGVSRWNIQGNLIESTTNTRGIFLAGSEKNTISSNLVRDNLGVDHLPPVFGTSVGLSVLGSKSNTFCCNVLDGSEIGAMFIGTCLGTDFRHTDFTRHAFSIMEAPGTRSEPQIDKFNIFNPTSGVAVHDGDFFERQDSKFWVYGNNGVHTTPWWPEVLNTSEWFYPSTTANGNLSTFLCNNDPQCSLPQVFPPYIIEETDRRTAQGVFDGPEHGAALPWESRRYLYAKIKQQNNLLGQDSIVDAFYTDAESGHIGAFYEAEKSAAALYELPLSWQNELHRLDSLLQANDLAESLLLAGLPQATTHADSATLYMSSDVVRLSADSIQHLMAVQVAQTDSLYRAKAWALLPILAALPDSTPLESNRKTVLTIWADREAKDSLHLTPTQFSLISSIAHQCPFDGGDAVYTARALYQRNERKAFRDDSCGQLVPRMPPLQRKTTFERTLTLSPNPTDGLLYLTVKGVPPDQEAVLQIANGMGQVIWSNALPLSSDYIAADASSLPNGLYFCTLTVGGIRLPTARLIIQH